MSGFCYCPEKSLEKKREGRKKLRTDFCTFGTVIAGCDCFHFFMLTRLFQGDFSFKHSFFVCVKRKGDMTDMNNIKTISADRNKAMLWPISAPQIHEWMIDWMTDWLNEWMNECRKTCVQNERWLYTILTTGRTTVWRADAHDLLWKCEYVHKNTIGQKALSCLMFIGQIFF